MKKFYIFKKSDSDTSHGKELTGFFLEFLLSFSWSKRHQKWASATSDFLTSTCNKTQLNVTEGTG